MPDDYEDTRQLHREIGRLTKDNERLRRIVESDTTLIERQKAVIQDLRDSLDFEYAPNPVVIEKLFRGVK